MFNEIRLILVTGEDVYYGVCGNFLKPQEVLTEIKAKPYIRVTYRDERVAIYTDKVVGCYIKKP